MFVLLSKKIWGEGLERKGHLRMMAPTAAAPRRLKCLCRDGFSALLGLAHLRDNFADGGVRAGAGLFAPRFEPRAMRFEIAEEFLAGEHFAPSGEHGLHLLEDGPFFAAVFKKKVFVNETAIGHAGDQFPISKDLAHMGVFLGAWRTDPHYVVQVLRMEMIGKPLPRLPQF